MTNESSSLPLINDSGENNANYLNPNDLNAKSSLISVIDFDSEGLSTPLSASSSLSSTSSFAKPDLTEIKELSSNSTTHEVKSDEASERNLSSNSDEDIKIDEPNRKGNDIYTSLNTQNIAISSNSDNDIKDSINKSIYNDVVNTSGAKGSSASEIHTSTDETKPDAGAIDIEMDLEINEYDLTTTLDDKVSELPVGQPHDSNQDVLINEKAHVNSSAVPAETHLASKRSIANDSFKMTTTAHANAVDELIVNTADCQQTTNIKPSVLDQSSRNDDPLKIEICSLPTIESNNSYEERQKQQQLSKSSLTQ